MNKRRWIRSAATAAALGALPTAVLACTIIVKPLWERIYEADAIVLAMVESVETPLPGETESPVPRVRLHVIERWKGNTESELSVLLGVCTPGDVFPVFLAKSEDGASWELTHVGYDLLNAPPEDLEVYATRIREAVDMQSKKKGHLDRLEWLVRCAEHPATRWDGLLVFSGTPEDEAEGGVMCIPPSELLTDEHRDRMVHAFLRDPQLDYSIPLLIEVLGDYPDGRFDRAVIAAIDRAVDAAEDVYTCRGTMAAMLTRMGDENPDGRLPDIPIQPDAAYWAELRKSWDAARLSRHAP